MGHFQRISRLVNFYHDANGIASNTFGYFTIDIGRDVNHILWLFVSHELVLQPHPNTILSCKHVCSTKHPNAATHSK